jgi:methanogenic corrinoid protein MtbC1
VTAVAATPSTSQQRFWASLQAGDVDAGRSVVGEELAAGVSGASILTTLLVPAQREVGARWQRAEWSVADEHASTAIVDAALAMVEQGDAGREPTGVSVVLACAESEWHSLPARFAAQLLRENGIQVRFLGPSLPADHLREYLARLAPDALVLSTTMPTSLLGAGRCIDAAHDVGVPVVAGGAAFGPDKARAWILGADAWFGDVTQLAVPPLRAPRAPGEPVPAWSASRAVQVAAEAACDGAFAQLLRDLPAFAAAATPAQLARTREDLAHIVDFVAVAVLVDDARVFTGFSAWLSQVLEARGVPARALSASYAALSRHLDGRAASLLAAAAGSQG